MLQKQKTILAFGTFDGLHDGHRYFLREARKLGNRLVVSVAQDSVVQKLKNHPPHKPLVERIVGLRVSGLADEAVGGDTQLGNWTAVNAYEPDIIALGYDQLELEKGLRAYIGKENLPILLTRIPACEPKKYHASLRF